MTKKFIALVNSLPDSEINSMNTDDWIFLEDVTDYYLLGKWIMKVENLSLTDIENEQAECEECGFDVHNDLKGRFSSYGYVFNKRKIE